MSHLGQVALAQLPGGLTFRLAMHVWLEEVGMARNDGDIVK